MKKIILLALLTMVLPAQVQAKEVSFDDVASEPSRYEGKSVLMKGSFLYSEPMRESFTIDQAGNRIEVFYSDLPNNDKQLILAEPKFSKRAMAVTGMLKQYTNNTRTFFLVATSVRAEAAGSPVQSSTEVISYADILSSPATYLNKPVTLKGSYLYGDAVRQSFGLDQNGTTVEVLLSDLSKMDRDLILSQKQYAKTPVTVTGLLQAYSNSSKKYYINAYSVRLDY